MITMRLCTSCKYEFPESNFYKCRPKDHTARKKKLSSHCKTCNIKDVKENAKLKKEYYNAWRREYYKRPEVQARMKARRATAEYKAIKKEAYKFWKANPEKVAKKLIYHKNRYKEWSKNSENVEARNAIRRERYRQKAELTRAAREKQRLKNKIDRTELKFEKMRIDLLKMKEQYDMMNGQCTEVTTNAVG